MKVVSPVDILKEIEESSTRSFLPIIGPVKGKYLVETVINSGAKKILEIGTLVGYSSILMASNLPKNGQITTIEINPQSALKAGENIRKAGLHSQIKILVGDAIQVIPGIRDSFDMIFIDAEKSEYMRYLHLSEPILKQNGTIFADNVKIFAEQVKDYLNYVRHSGKYSSRFIDVGFDGVEVSTKLT
jgi:predicted O-methyltransferase YrrM